MSHNYEFELADKRIASLGDSKLAISCIGAFFVGAGVSVSTHLSPEHTYVGIYIVIGLVFFWWSYRVGDYKDSLKEHTESMKQTPEEDISDWGVEYLKSLTKMSVWRMLLP